tara:strand:+ start:52 stop:351 length:300 start_codon:yes stop_codon:yes gene_type:complete
MIICISLSAGGGNTSVYHYLMMIMMTRIRRKNMCQITRINEFLESYKTLDPYLKDLVSSCKDHYVRQLFHEYEKKGIKNYQMMPNQNEINTLNKGIGII